MLKEEEPLITIITVVYNGVNVLEETIKSIKNLAYKNINYIVVDGGSNDGTLDIIRNHSDIINAWVSEQDCGVYDAMNKGWRMAAEKSYILFIGAGDKILSLPTTISQHYNEVVYGEVYKGNYLFPSIHNFKLKLGNTLHHQALLIPKPFNTEPPFDLKYKLYADFDFNQRLNKRNIAFRYSKEFKAFALPGGLSEVRDDTEMLSIVRKNYGTLMYLLALCYYKLQKIKTSIFK